MHHRLGFALFTGASLVAFAGPAMPAENSAPSGSAAGGVIFSNRPGEVVTELTKPPLNLSGEQQQAVIAAVLARKSHQPTPKEFRPEVGATVPPLVELHGMPPQLANEIPALKTHMYAHLDREIALIDPLEKKVVALVPLPEKLVQDKGGPDQKAEPARTIGGLGDLKPEQRQALYRSASAEAQPVPAQALLAGTEVPEGIVLQPLAREIVSQAPPRMQQWHYAKLQDGRMLLVDPASRKVEGIITREEGTSTASAGENAGATTGQGPGGGNSGIGSASPTADPLRAREEDGRPSAYTGPRSSE